MLHKLLLIREKLKLLNLQLKHMIEDVKAANNTIVVKPLTPYEEKKFDKEVLSLNRERDRIDQNRQLDTNPEYRKQQKLRAKVYQQENRKALTAKYRAYHQRRQQEHPEEYLAAQKRYLAKKAAAEANKKNKRNGKN